MNIHIYIYMFYIHAYIYREKESVRESVRGRERETRGGGRAAHRASRAPPPHTNGALAPEAAGAAQPVLCQFHPDKYLH